MAELTTRSFILSDPEIKADLNLLFAQQEKLIIFDIGACEGEDSIRYSRMYPNARIHLFEPRPDNLKKIDENLRNFECTSVTVSHLALSNSAGEATFYLSSGKPENAEDATEWDFGNKSSSLLPPGEKMKEHTSWLQFKEQLVVQTERLDTYCAANEIERIHLIHMDVQGAELMVLQGAGQMLQHIAAIWLEVEAVELYKNQPLRQDIERFMSEHNFICVKSTVNNVAGDQLYLNATLISKDKIESISRMNIRLSKIKKWKTRYYRLRNFLTGKK
jgi:FkbM family methyltransferase